MHNTTCIFCKIIHKELPTTVISETENVLVIQNIAPQAPIHYLIMPKKHVENILDLNDEDSAYGWEMLVVTRTLGKTVPQQSFNLIVNNGAAAGQSVFHLHFHFLSGKNLYESSFKL